ncbi:HupE/UreJ family protein [Flectobacillus longus]|uniref:HupE/UreJ family protein n=1 Tax=Flectobacillus longus TaxID=2984207 RepID=UPI0024B84313|nr:HupE/UreJ family protein [Flectobacillus longus]MDI9882556.1 HupE/UreJ family protein [Flectobacillus longus]
MSDFQLYLQLGFQHITDVNGYDHILFVIALCAVYRLSDWKKLAVLVTAFTLGHSVTLALATLQVITYRTEVVEFLIPITICLTCILNFFHKSVDNVRFQKEKSSSLRYPMAMTFGLIHGMGFSNYLRSLLGKEESLLNPLLAFNLGLELGQLLIVMFTLGISFLMLDIFKIKKHDWNLILSGIVAGVALTLITSAEYFQELLGNK